MSFNKTNFHTKTKENRVESDIQKSEKRSSSGSLGGPVSYDRHVLAEGQRVKYPKDQLTVQVIQRAEGIPSEGIRSEVRDSLPLNFP